MEVDIRELFDNNFDYGFRAVTYNNMKVALIAFEQFKKKNADFFTFDKTETVFGHLRTYAIEKQFSDSAFNPKANYSVSMKQVNNYKHKTLCIETDDFIVNLGRTSKENKLLPVSAYKREFAKANAGLTSQLEFNFGQDVPDVSVAKKYAEIIYGYRYGDMSHLQIVLPSADYRGIEYSTNLLEDIKVYESYVPEELVEESIVSLKKSLTREIQKIV